MMKWQEIRTKFPQSWVLVEAIEAHTDKSQRVIDRLSVIDRFPGFFEAMDVYKLLASSNAKSRDVCSAYTK